MQVIGILNTKGGTGKTTLATCLAVRAAQEKQVAVVDLDPQSSYSEWYARRSSPDNPALLVGEDRASDAIEAIRLASPYEIILLDGPPGSILVTEDAIKVSSFVLIPIRASGLDIGSSRDCIQMCQDAGTPYLVVINGKGQHDGKLVQMAQELLASWKVPVAETIIPSRVQYVNAITTGQSGPEKDRKCAEDIEALWTEIQAAIKKAARSRKVAR